MIELSFLEFHEQQYNEEQFCLYVVKHLSEETLYVGISTNNIWERWFSWGGHMTWDGKVIYGESPIGLRIENHLPDSLQWKIQLWNLKDCLEFCRDQLSEDVSEITIHDLEPLMIRKLSPVLNATYNLNPSKNTMPRSKKQDEQEKLLDRLYKELFDKK